MGKNQRIVTTVLWAAAVSAMLGVVATGLWAKKNAQARDFHGDVAAAGTDAAQLAASDGQTALPTYYEAPAFSLTDQNKQTVTRDSLRGNVWVAMVFFTHCPGICPGMVGRMSDLQKSVTDPRVKLVSVSLDPEHDTPEHLKQYADQLGADSGRWFLLTGTKDQVLAVAEGLKLSAAPATDDAPITHTGKMLLVDGYGNVRGVYESKDDESMKKLADDARALVAQIGKAP